MTDLGRFPGGRVGFVAGQVTLVLVAVALAVVGYRSVLDTTEGRAVDPVVDPDEPGFEAFVEPTPTLLVAGRRSDGSLDWVALLVLGGPGQQGGTVALLPTDSGIDTDSGVVTLAAAEVPFGAEGLRTFVSNVYRAGIDDVIDLSPSRLESLVAGVGDLTFTNPDGAPGFPAGPVQLAPGDVAAFLAATEDGESQLTRLSRHEAFWMAWLEAIAASPSADVVPGETTTGIGRFLRGLAAAPSTVAVPELEPGQAADGSPALVAAPEALAAFAVQLIPLPASPQPGVRPLVRVLDGIGADGLAERAVRTVVEAGGQVVIVGNANPFDPDATSRVIYVDEEAAAAAEALADELGIPAEQSQATGADPVYDVTVVVGADLMAAYGLSPRTTVADDQDPT